MLDNSFSNCTSILLFTIRERFWNTRVCQSNRLVLFNFVRNNFSIRRSHFIYSICSTIFFRNCTSVIFITIWNIWSKHTRLQVKSTRSLCSRSRMHVMNLYRKSLFKTIFNSFVMNFSTKFSSKTTLISSWKRRNSGTYEERLANLKNSHWFSSYHSKKAMIVAEFDIIDLSDFAKCTRCEYWFMQSDCEKSLTKHSFHCLLSQELHKEIAKRAELKKIEELKTMKLISVVVDIDYFDSILLCDIQKFDLHHETIIFCQHLQNIRINYREIDLIQLFHICLRDFAFV